MKVLHFGRFYSPYFGGLERHVELLLTSLNRTIGADNIVANDRFKNEVLEVNGYRVYKIASLGLLAGTAVAPGMLLRARSLCKMNKYDIVHLHFPDPLSHLAAAFLPPNVKVVISWHSDVVRQENLLTLYKPFLDRLVRRADAIIAATPLHFSTSTQLSACLSKDRLHVIPYGIDIDRFALTREVFEATAVIRKRYEGKKLVFSVARHVYYKGYEYLLQAMKSVDALLLLGGTGPLHEDLKRQAEELQLAGKVVFLGRVPDNDLPAYYHAAEVSCMPSVERSEAFGIVQVEAMACRKPIVCCELNNGVTYVNQPGVTGLAVPPREPLALAAALNELLCDERKRTAMGEAGYARVCQEFTIDRMCRDTLGVYRQVCAEKTY